ncbi:retrovirus-related pol polyprotein from transposon TNT 1-94 [Tanacetum coccineum]|uniref:Retrovirus-related pol polyprotein from transposon TNT 1-94 n=1 Tax=Tanacetum coccineum TaxID=301880 RepID=A0ABQ4YSJ8_9ASTR
MTESPFGDSGFVVLVFYPGDDLIACLNNAMAFLTAVASSRFPSTNNQLKTASNPRNQATIQDGRAMLLVQGEIQQVDKLELLNATTAKEKAMLAEAQEAGQILDEEQLAFLADPGILADQAQTIIPHDAAFQTRDLDTYDSDGDYLSTAQAVLMANISNYGSDIISEVPNSETYLNDRDNQSVHALQDFEQTLVIATVQDTNLQAQQDSMILSMIEQISDQMTNHVNNWEKANKEQKNESITAELERYKERVKIFKQRLNIDLSSREKMIDSQMDDMIKEKLALKENENKIDLEKNIKELDNIVYKAGQSTQTVHMLTKPQSFYGNIHKQALDYQNPFYLKKAQRIKPTLYDGCVISEKHDAMPMVDDEETLILEEESRSKMSEKAKDPEAIKQNISHKPIDYEKLNRLTEDFGKHFSSQQELSAEQAFWFRIVNPSIEPSYTPPVIVDVPSELSKVSLVNASLKKLKFHLTQFDSVVRKRTTPSALEEGYYLRENTKEENVNPDKCDLEPINKELENNVAKLISENERLCNEINHVKQVFKDQFESIKQTRVRHKEQCESLINKLNLKSMELEDLKAQIQDKVFVITSLKNDLRKLKGKEIIENVVHIPSANTIAPGMFKLDIELLPPRLLQNREVYIDYLRNTQEQANILWEIVEQAKAKQPLDGELDLAGKYATRIQEFLVYVQDMCPNAITPSAKKVTVKLMNNVKKVRFAEPLTSSSCPDCTVRFGNDQIARIIGYGEYQLGNVVISRTKDEAPAAIIKCIKNIQVRLKATVQNVRTDNGTKFVNQTLREWYENVGITHQTSVARTLQQNGVVERQNQTLIEAARTMLIFSKALLFLWAEAINTACYTQNRSLICLRYNKTSYELMQDKKPDLSVFYVFGSLCYPTNNHEDLVPEAGALRAKVLANSPMSTSIDQDASSTSITSS